MGDFDGKLGCAAQLGPKTCPNIGVAVWQYITVYDGVTWPVQHVCLVRI